MGKLPVAPDDAARARRVSVRFLDGERAEGSCDRLILSRQGLHLMPESGPGRAAWIPLSAIKYVVVHDAEGALAQDPRAELGLPKVMLRFTDGEALRTYQDDVLEQVEEGFQLRILDEVSHRLVRLLVPVQAVARIYEVSEFEEVPAPAPDLALAATPKAPTAMPVAHVSPPRGAAVDPELQRLAGSYLRRLAGVDDVGLSSDEDGIFEQALRRQVARLLREDGLPLGEEARERLLVAIMRDARGYGPLDALLEDPEISEIMVNGPDEVFVERGGLLLLTDIRFQSEEHLVQILRRMAATVGRRIDASSPLLDARLPDGSRLNAVLRPLATKGTSLTIRKFRSFLSNISDLVVQKSLNAAMAEFLSWAVEGRLNILVSGGTGSGKTTMLNALAAAIPPNQRLITIEDAAELQINHPHVVGLECRPANVEGKGALDVRSLVKNSLRMRPDRLIIGEVRGAEALDMLQAMNTGHDGSMSTIHSNSPKDAFSRLEMMVLGGASDIPLEAVRGQITAAINLIVQQARLIDGARKVTQICEVLGYEKGSPVLEPIFELRRGEFCATGYVPQAAEKAAFHGVRMPARLFERQAPDPVIRVLG